MKGRRSWLVLIATVAVVASGAAALALTCKGDAPLPSVLLEPADPALLLASPDGSLPRAPGCGKAAEYVPGATMRIIAGARTFHVYPPRAYDPNHAYPIVFAFHGWYSNGADFEKWFKMEDHVNGEAFVVYPDARESWNGAWDLRGTSDLVFFDTMRAAIINAYCIDLNKAFAFGFSYGGKFVHVLGCKRSDVLRAISVGDGSFAENDDAKCKPLPVLITHRTRDTDERFDWGKESVERWSKINGCAGTTTVSDPAHGCVSYDACKAPLEFCEDTYFNPSWPKTWNHTVREEYRDLTWQWLKSQ